MTRKMRIVAATLGLLVVLASGTLGESGERKVDSGKVERWKS